MPIERLNINNLIWPTPKEKISNPKKTEVNVGDFVRSKIGSVKGKIGIVVVERNANYVDKIDEVQDDSIGIAFAEHENYDAKIKEIISKLTGNNDDISINIRWFNNTSQFEILASTKDNI